MSACHGKIVRFSLYFLWLASPDLSRTLAWAQTLPVPPSQGLEATVERPDFNIRLPRPTAPGPGEYDMVSDSQESDGKITRLRGHVVVELFNATFKANDAEYDEETKTFKARGQVSYRNYDHDEVIYCDYAEYNMETRRGTFHHLRGYTKTKVVARPGILTTQEPFYFEGARAEKFEDKYVLYDGMITDCHIPNPWWTMNSKVFEIFPDDRAVTHRGIFKVRNVPVFYLPYFYKGLKKEPRKSGFTTPEAGHSSQFGYFVGAGYYWAINRSYDATYVLQDYITRGLAHHADFRGKPTANSDFNFIIYGVQDRGTTINKVFSKSPGASVTGVAKAELGRGWFARVSLDYLSSFQFRQTFSASFNEAIYTSTMSSGFVTKKFDYYTFNGSISRTENFESTAVGDSVVIRKLPELDFQSRDQQIRDLPLWFSFTSDFGLFHRVQPKGSGFYETNQFTPRGDFQPTLTTAFHWKGLNVVPSFTLHESIYSQSYVNNTVRSIGLKRNAPDLNIDVVLPSVSRVFNGRLKHVIEPRVKYRYVTGVNQFANTLRFDQLDLLSNTSDLEIGVINRLYAKRGDVTSEVFSWELSQKRYFDQTFGGAVVAGQRNLILAGLDLTGYSFLNGPRNYSPVVSVLRASPRPGWAIQWQADYDPLRAAFTNSTLSADLRVQRYFVSLGSNLLKPDPLIAPPANQFRAQVGYGDPNRRGWNGAFSTIYDYRLALLQFAVGQVTYNTDCCGVSVEWKRSNYGIRDDTVYRVAFSIANIGTFGNLKKQERLF